MNSNQPGCKRTYCPCSVCGSQNDVYDLDSKNRTHSHCFCLKFLIRYFKIKLKDGSFKDKFYGTISKTPSIYTIPIPCPLYGHKIHEYVCRAHVSSVALVHFMRSYRHLLETDSNTQTLDIVCNGFNRIKHIKPPCQFKLSPLPTSLNSYSSSRLFLTAHLPLVNQHILRCWQVLPKLVKSQQKGDAYQFNLKNEEFRKDTYKAIAMEFNLGMNYLYTNKSYGYKSISTIYAVTLWRLDDSLIPDWDFRQFVVDHIEFKRIRALKSILTEESNLTTVKSTSEQTIMSLGLLPSEIMLRIFWFLSNSSFSLIKASCVCKLWNQIALDDILWKRIYVLTFGKDQLPISNKPWSQRFLSTARSQRDCGDPNMWFRGDKMTTRLRMAERIHARRAKVKPNEKSIL